jgi:TrmH family RNA methyltransferase
MNVILSLSKGAYASEVTTLGLHSPKLDAVRDLRTKRGRREHGRYAVEGATMLSEALTAGIEPEAIYVTSAGFASLPEAAKAIYERLFEVPDRAMARISELEAPPGIVAIFPIVFTPLDELLGAGRPAVVLAGVSDPGNAGTLLRSAEIFGLPGAIFLDAAVEPHNPKVVRASMGAIFRLALAVAKPDDISTAAKRHGYTLVAAAHDGEPLPGFRFPERFLIAIGHERRGVAEWLPSYDRAVAIPQRGGGESLNAAVAGGIIFYAFSQQV